MLVLKCSLDSFIIEMIYRYFCYYRILPGDYAGSLSAPHLFTLVKNINVILSNYILKFTAYHTHNQNSKNLSLTLVGD